MKRRSIQLLGIGIMSAMLLMGCGGSNTTSKGSAANGAGSESSSESTDVTDSKTYGQITAIDGSSITVAIGTRKQRGNKGEDPSSTGRPERPNEGADGNDGGGNPPSGNPPEGNAPNGGAAGGSVPEGNAAGGSAVGGDGTSDHAPGGSGQTPPSGQPEMPSGTDDANKVGGNRPSFLDLTGESKTLTITDSTVINIKSQSSSSGGSLSDLQVGDTISFELAEDGTTVKTINKQSMGGGNKGQGQKSASNKTST